MSRKEGRKVGRKEKYCRQQGRKRCGCGRRGYTFPRAERQGLKEGKKGGSEEGREEGRNIKYRKEGRKEH
jgi:hypothetical protein